MTTASAASGAVRASSDNRTEPPSSPVAITGFPKPPVKIDDFALSTVVMPCVRLAVPPPAMTAAIHFTIGGTSVMTAAHRIVPATNAAGVAKASSRLSTPECNRPAPPRALLCRALSAQMVSQATRSYCPTIDDRYRPLRSQSASAKTPESQSRRLTPRQAQLIMRDRSRPRLINLVQRQTFGAEASAASKRANVSLLHLADIRSR